MPNSKNELAKYLATSDHETYSKALHLSNLCYLAAYKNNKHAYSALSKIVSSSSSKTISRLSARLTEASKDRLLDARQVDVINIARKFLLSNKCFADKLSTKAIIDLGQDPELCRLAIYRLIQLANPEMEIVINHNLFKVGVDQSSEQVSKCYSDVQNLPEELFKLATSSQNANIVIAEISQNIQRFNIIERLIQKHPMLAYNVADDWNKLLRCNDISNSEKSALEKSASRLGDIYPEFNKLIDIRRTPRSQLSIEESNQERVDNRYLRVFQAIWGGLSGPPALTALKGGGAVSSTLFTAPVLLFAVPIVAASLINSKAETSRAMRAVPNN